VLDAVFGLWVYTGEFGTGAQPKHIANLNPAARQKPMTGAASSLNAADAIAAVRYEIARQRILAGRPSG